VIELETIYRRTLQECAPDVIVRTVPQTLLSVALPTVISIGKCAGPLLDGVAGQIEIDRAFVVVPHGYPEPKWRGNVIVAHGGHPQMDRASFYAGDALMRFMDEIGTGDVLFLISGGGSACVESPLPPFSRDELIAVNARLVSSSLPIGEINTVRKHLSAIKGGRLGARVHGRSLTLVYSDVSSGAIADVASGPTVADATTVADAMNLLRRLGLDAIAAKLREETVKHIDNSAAKLIADNVTLTATAARIVGEMDYEPVLLHDQIETDVEAAAHMLAERAKSLSAKQVLVAGGETTVVIRGNGRGGRCCELAARFAMQSPNAALFGSSDGVDGSSGVAGIRVAAAAPGRRTTAQAAVATLLQTSDSLAAASLVGRPIMIPPTGNNLRDLFLVAADSGVMAHH
jgi:glycerate 2-kinase